MSLTQRTLWVDTQIMRRISAPTNGILDRSGYRPWGAAPPLRSQRCMETKPDPAANSTADGLCYLSARHVAMRGGTLDGLELCNSEHESVGTVDGVLIDAPERRVRYFVVKLRPSDHVLLSVDEIVHVHSDADVPHLEAAPGARLLQFDPQTVRPFSADDAVTSIFAGSNSNAA